MTLSLYIIRHTRVGVGPTMCYGASDVALADSWPDEFASVAARLPLAASAHYPVYSSPLTRCARLADHLCRTLSGIGAPGDPPADSHAPDLAPDVPMAVPIHDHRLKEMDFGRWELTPWAEIPAAEHRAWIADVEHRPAPGGESFGQVVDRARQAVQEIEHTVSANGHPGAVLVTHGGVARALLATVLGCGAEQALRLEVDYGGITQVELGPRPRVRFVNR